MQKIMAIIQQFDYFVLFISCKTWPKNGNFHLCFITMNCWLYVTYFRYLAVAVIFIGIWERNCQRQWTWSDYSSCYWPICHTYAWLYSDGRYKMPCCCYGFVLQGKMISYSFSNFVRTCKSNIFMGSFSVLLHKEDTYVLNLFYINCSM